MVQHCVAVRVRTVWTLGDPDLQTARGRSRPAPCHARPHLLGAELSVRGPCCRRGAAGKPHVEAPLPMQSGPSSASPPPSCGLTTR